MTQQKCSPGTTYSVCLQVDNRQQQDLLVSASQAADLCDRHFGIGADGVCTCVYPA